MLVKCQNGVYHLTNNFREAFDEAKFLEKYLEECFDGATYIVGDISAGILRLKGFNNDPKSESFSGNISDYMNKFCVIGCPYYILHRLTDKEYEKLNSNPKLAETNTEGFTINTLEKISFEKEALNLKSNPKENKHIEINVERANQLPKGSLPADLKEIAIKEAQKDNSYRRIENKIEPEPVNTQTYVSSSNGFDPSKVNRNPKFNRPNKNRNNNNNNNNNNGNKNKKPNNKRDS